MLVIIIAALLSSSFLIVSNKTSQLRLAAVLASVTIIVTMFLLSPMLCSMQFTLP